jgi:cytochrome c553
LHRSVEALAERRAGAVTSRRLWFAAAILGSAAVLVGIAGSLFIWFGFFDVSASSGHSPPVEWLLHFAMERSVAFYAPERAVPDLDDPHVVLRGALHYASGCAPCHAAPGELASPIARRMTPVPPGLYSAARDFDPSQLFWIVQNGLKMTAMPAWPAPGRDDEIWAMVAFLEQLPRLKTPDYLTLVGEPGASWLPAPPTAVEGAFDVAACSRCHGADGRGRDGAFASIAGLGEADIEAALRGYRDGSKPSGFMQPIAAQLSDAQIVAAAQHYAALPPAGAP